MARRATSIARSMTSMLKMKSAREGHVCRDQRCRATQGNERVRGKEKQTSDGGERSTGFAGGKQDYLPLPTLRRSQADTSELMSAES